MAADLRTHAEREAGLSLRQAHEILVGVGLDAWMVIEMRNDARLMLARRLRALERVVTKAKVVCDEMKACRMPYASDMAELDTALESLESEVAGGR